MFMFSWCSTYEPVERNFVHTCTLYVQLNDNKIATYLPTEDWTNDAENSALITEINYISKYIHIDL